MENAGKWAHINTLSSQLAAQIWGHRFKEGQRGAEYVLEFLNVLVGSGYHFQSDTYRRKKSVGLREFVFEGVKEGSGAGQKLVLKEGMKQKLRSVLSEEKELILKQFLRNLEISLLTTTGKEANRSWFARSLYPLHESLLFSELRVKNGEPEFERNFYARGGELYFLMLAHGVANDDRRCSYIEDRFASLLQRSQNIASFVQVITDALDHPEEADKSNLAYLRSVNGKQQIPILPDKAEVQHGQLFEGFARDLERLLMMNLDVHHFFQLLTSLACFHLFRYSHARAAGNEALHYFIDCMEGANRDVYKQSAVLFERHEYMVKQCFKEAFDARVDEYFGQDEQQLLQRLAEWQQDEESFIKEFLLGQLRKSNMDDIKKVLRKCRTVRDVRMELKSVIEKTVMSNFEHVEITRVLARDGGFSTYRRGPGSNNRYTMSDAFLQMLVFTHIEPGQQLEFHDFLQTVYHRHGIVIGEVEAKDSDIYKESRLNVRYFQDNERALRRKLKQNGLLIEFSDATAMVENPHSVSERREREQEVHYG